LTVDEKQSMLNPLTALQGALRPMAPTPLTALHPVLVFGAGGPLGSAVVQALLGAGFNRVGAVVQRPLHHAVRGFVPVADEAQAWQALGMRTAVVVFEAATSRLKLDAPFAQPEPAQLPALAQRLRASGVRAMLVATPHRAGLLPRALQQGLASLDEQAVAAVGFEQLAFMRIAQDSTAQAAAPAPQRLARWMLSQMRWMIPQQEQAVRLETVARVAAAWAALWPQAQPGTRVLPSELLWQAAQVKDARSVVRPWLMPPG
jgi:NADPH:quinone reductase-like Zn-dependent oxidoreductase